MCRVRKKNGWVTVIGTSNNAFASANDYKALTTLPAKYRPDRQIVFTGNSMGNTASVIGFVSTDGVAKLYSTASTNYWNFSFTYPVSD